MLQAWHDLLVLVYIWGHSKMMSHIIFNFQTPLCNALMPVCQGAKKILYNPPFMWFNLGMVLFASNSCCQKKWSGLAGSKLVNFAFTYSRFSKCSTARGSNTE